MEKQLFPKLDLQLLDFQPDSTARLNGAGGRVIRRIFKEAFGLRQAVTGGFGAVLMNGVKRGLFSNEAGSGSAPCAAAAVDTDHPAKTGLLQALMEYHLGRFGVSLKTVFNIAAILPMSRQALVSLRDYEGIMKARKQAERRRIS